MEGEDNMGTATVTTTKLNHRGLYGARPEELKELVPALYESCEESFKANEKTCMIHVVVSNAEELKRANKLIDGMKAISFKFDEEENNLAFKDYAVRISIANKFDSSMVIEKFKSTMKDYRNIGFVLFGMPEPIEEYIIDYFIKEGRMTGILVKK